MRKFLLVTLIGMALTFYLYGVVNDLIEKFEAKNEVNDTSVTVVHVE